MLTALRDRPIAGTLATTVLFLFFFQLVTSFVEAIYAFGLLGTSIPPEIVSVLLFFAPVALLVAPRFLGRHAQTPLALLMIACRLTAGMLDTRGRLLVAGVGVAAALLWLPLLLWQVRRDGERPASQSLTLSLLTAVLLAIALRAAGSGLDPSTRGPFQVLGWLLAGLAVYVLVLMRRATAGAPESATTRSPGSAVPFGRLVAWVVGLNSVLVLLYFAFTSPNVIARWTGAGYLPVVAALMLGIAVYGASCASRSRWLAPASQPLLWALNGAFVLALVTTLLIHQVRFDGDPGAYPLYARDVPLVAHIPLFAMLFLVPVIFVDFALYVRAFATARLSLRALGGAFALGSLYWVGMIFAHVFTTVYDYIPVVGPAFRDAFWLVYLAAGLGLVLPLLAVHRLPLKWAPAPEWARASVLLAVVAVAGVVLTMARPGDAPTQPTLNVLTYNIQQGYGADGQMRFDDQLALMRAADADLIGLQESDTNRIAGGNADLVRAYADALHMHAYYGPTTVAGTFGIALLSRYPLENPRTFYMYSVGEQTATLSAQITVGQETVNVFVTHLGNGGPVVQQEAILEVVAGMDNVILMGDFNFRPESDQYSLTTGVLDDGWLCRWPGGTDDRGVAPTRRIDHIFVSPAFQVEDIRYIDSPVSDHPAVTAVLRLE